MKIHRLSWLARPNFFIMKRRASALSDGGFLSNGHAPIGRGKEFKAGKGHGWPSDYGDRSEREAGKTRLKIQGSRGSRERAAD